MTTYFKNQTMNNSVKTIFLLNIFVLIQFLSGMDQPSVPMQGNDVAFGLVFTNYLADHKAICSFAKTGKVQHALMCATAEKRKKTIFKIEAVCPFSEDSVEIMWNKYGSAFCYMSVFSIDDDTSAKIPNNLEQQPTISRMVKFPHFILKSNDFVMYKISICRADNLISSLPHNPAPFVNEKGKLCFYGYGDIEIPLPCIVDKKSVLYRHVIRYCIDGSARRCSVEYKNREYDLTQLLSYPDCLKALLDSSVREIIHATCCNKRLDRYLVYSFKDAIIPDGYVFNFEEI
jgi:hypothetical protein